MMSAFSGLMLTLSEHPWLVAVVFFASLAVVFNLFSEGEPRKSFFGLLEVGWSYFTTPFMFLRNALRLFREGPEREQPYVGTWEHVIYRANRFVYLGIFLASLAVFSGGVASALIALYPATELQERKTLGEQLDELHKQQEEQKKIVEDASNPGFRQRLLDRARIAKADLEKADAEYNSVNNGITFTSPLLNSIRQANTAEELDRVKETFETYFEDCPTGDSWTNFTPELCRDLRKDVDSLEAKRRVLIQTYYAKQEAENTASAGESAAESAKERVETLQDQIDETTKQYDDASLLSRPWIKEHIKAFALTIGTSIIVVILIVWSGAIFADVSSWLVLMMLRLEKSTPASLRPESLSASPNGVAPSPPPPPQPPPPEATARVWHFHVAGEPDARTGTALTILRLHEQGVVVDDTLLWTDGLDTWVRYADVIGRLQSEAKT